MVILYSWIHEFIFGVNVLATFSCEKLKGCWDRKRRASSIEMWPSLSWSYSRNAVVRSFLLFITHNTTQHTRRSLTVSWETVSSHCTATVARIRIIRSIPPFERVANCRYSHTPLPVFGPTSLQQGGVVSFRGRQTDRHAAYYIARIIRDFRLTSDRRNAIKIRSYFTVRHLTISVLQRHKTCLGGLEPSPVVRRAIGRGICTYRLITSCVLEQTNGSWVKWVNKCERVTWPVITGQYCETLDPWLDIPYEV